MVNFVSSTGLAPAESVRVWSYPQPQKWWITNCPSPQHVCGYPLWELKLQTPLCVHWLSWCHLLPKGTERQRPGSKDRREVSKDRSCPQGRSTWALAEPDWSHLAACMHGKQEAHSTYDLSAQILTPRSVGPSTFCAERETQTLQPLSGLFLLFRNLLQRWNFEKSGPQS